MVCLLFASGGQGALLKNCPLDPRKIFYYLFFVFFVHHGDALLYTDIGTNSAAFTITPIDFHTFYRVFFYFNDIGGTAFPAMAAFDAFGKIDHRLYYPPTARIGAVENSSHRAV
jgi:hypothetical protein